MRVPLVLAAVLGLFPAAAGAATLTYSAFFPSGTGAGGEQAFSPTDWDGTTQSVTLPQFDQSLGTLTDASLDLYTDIRSFGTLVNTGSSTATVRSYVAFKDISMQLPDGTALLASPQEFSVTGPITLAPGESYAFGTGTPNAGNDINGVSATSLDPYVGTGSVLFPLLSSTRASTPYVNEALQVNDTTTARMQATITYTYAAGAAPPTPVPEPASAALLGAGLLGLGLVRRRG